MGPLTTDGPFADTKEVFGGYYMFDVADLDEALELAARVPSARLGGKVEIRPIVEQPSSAQPFECFPGPATRAASELAGRRRSGGRQWALVVWLREG